MDVDMRELNLTPPERGRWNQQLQILALFDNLVGNADRNQGNVLIDRGWNIWFIDHTRCFTAAKKPLQPELVTHCERRLWQGLKGLDEDTLRQRLEPYLLPHEMKALIARWRAMVSHIEKLIARSSEGLVLFDLPPPRHPPVDWPER
jgi:hypothetical protein